MMRRLPAATVIVAVAATALGAGYYWAAHRGMDIGIQGIATDTGRSSDFVLPDLTGVPRRLNSWSGHTVMLNFWASWCAPCVEEIPLLIAAQKRYGERGLQVVGIAVDQREAAAAFSARYAINYPVLIADDTTFDLMARYGNPSGALPYTVIFAPNGAILQRKLGAFRSADLEQALTAGLETPK